MSERWMVVRPDWSLPGGYRVVQHGLSQGQAEGWAAEYKTPHEAMSEDDLIQRRLAGLANERAT